MKMELEKKDRELKEARRLIEEIKKNQTKKGNGVEEASAAPLSTTKVYYETPRSREGIRGLSGEKIKVNVGGSNMRCETPKSESPALRKSYNSNALTPT
jgi:hypothetical protein